MPVGKGSVAEWSIAPVLKTGDGQPSVSSNLTASAISPIKSLKKSLNPTKNPPNRLRLDETSGRHRIPIADHADAADGVDDGLDPLSG
jgi:hypothetical protein